MLSWTTADRAAHEQGIKLLVYAESGYGKTRLCATTPNIVIGSAEAGLRSLKGFNIPAAELKSIEDTYEFYRWCTSSKEANQFATICLDSLSEIGELVLTERLKTAGRDPRQAYGQLIAEMSPLIRAFRDIKGKNVYMTAKLEQSVDEVNKTLRFGPSMPGRKMGPMLPYFFDEVYCLRLHPTKDPQGNNYRYIQTQPDFQYGAKTRSNLSPMEPPDLNYLFSKILGG